MTTPISTPLPRPARTKIVATLGPASRTADTIRRLVQAGADVFRLNFSHGAHAEHLDSVHAIRTVGRELGVPLAILGDLCGPKLRLGMLREEGGVAVRKGDTIVLTPEPADGTNRVFPLGFKELHDVARPGDSVLLDDGQVVLEVERVEPPRVYCRVGNDSVIKSRKGVNLPQSSLPIPALTDKDRLDLRFCLDHDVDLLALSFVRKPDDLRLAIDEMHRAGKRIPLLAKIEMGEAIQHLDDILDTADGAMVARGDLGIEIPLEHVPTVQKQIIHGCNRRAKPVITATQMLDSMIRNPRPTRAEVSDVYNAILDGTDAVMLSGETAVGQYPVDTVATMNRIAVEAESVLKSTRAAKPFRSPANHVGPQEAFACAAVDVAERLALDAILVPTLSGSSARFVSRFRPDIPILACTPSPSTLGCLCLLWGVLPVLTDPAPGEEPRSGQADLIIQTALRAAKKEGFLRAGMKVVALGGLPLGKAHHTNFVLVIDVTDSP